MTIVSKGEIEVLKRLSAEGLSAGLVTQKPIILKATIPDFCYPDRKLAIYLDGVQVHNKKHVEARDEEIDNLLECLGWTVHRIRYEAPLTQQRLKEIMAELRDILAPDTKT